MGRATSFLIDRWLRKACDIRILPAVSPCQPPSTNLAWNVLVASTAFGHEHGRKSFARPALPAFCAWKLSQMAHLHLVYFLCLGLGSLLHMATSLSQRHSWAEEAFCMCFMVWASLKHFNQPIGSTLQFPGFIKPALTRSIFCLRLETQPGSPKAGLNRVRNTFILQ